MGFLVDIIIIGAIALSTFLAYKKGLVAQAIKLCAVIIAIIAAVVLILLILIIICVVRRKLKNKAENAPVKVADNSNVSNEINIDSGTKSNN